MIRQKMRSIVFISSLLAGLAWLASTWMIVAEPTAYGKRDAKEAWEALLESAQDRMRAAGGDEASILREIVRQLEAFTQNHPGTKQATLALMNRSALAASLGDYEVAEQSLIQAGEQTQDPELSDAINLELARLRIRPGQTPPAFTARTLAGNTITLEDYKGKVVLLDFWATWCMPCLIEIPSVKKVYAAYHDRGFEIVGISLDSSEDALRKFVKEKDMSWAHIYDAALPEGKDIQTKFLVNAIPQTILIGRDGKIEEVGLRGSILEAAVKKAIEPAKPLIESVEGPRPARATIGQLAPVLALDEWVRGNPTTLDDLRGKVVLLDIFQIICPGCHKAHPEIARMQKQYKEDGFEILGLAVAFELHGAQTPEKIRRYVDRKAYPYPVALDKGLIETFRRYGARGTPYTVLIDRQGRIRYLDFFRLEKVESTIRRLLNEDIAK